ncbi:MAG: acetolactate synthase small subunit [Bacteroidales bacterium]
MNTMKHLYTVSVYSENHVGLLSQISNIFTRRNLNIETLTVSPSSIKGIHKFTISTYSDSFTMNQLVTQIEKKIDVVKAYFYENEEIIHQEVALFKVSTSGLFESKEIENIVNKFHAEILEVNPTYTVIKKSGTTDYIDELFNQLSSMDVILQFTRSGRVCITKETKEKVSDFIQEQEKCRIS